MKKSLAMILSLFAIPTVLLAEIDTNAVVGSALGAAAGSALGSATGGRDGAVIGGGIGGAVGAAISTKPQSTTSTRVIEQRQVVINDEKSNRGLHKGWSKKGKKFHER